MIFSEINAFASLVEKASKIIKRYTKSSIERNVFVSSRFIELFEAHGVHRNQIPRAFGHNLTLADVQSDSHLLANLNEEILEDACSLFNIQRAWLDGADKQVYPTYDFYNNPNGFKEFIEKLTPDSEHKISGVLLTPREGDNERTALLLIQQIIGYIEDRPYYRYYLLDNWQFSYWKSRAYLTSCIAHCWARKVHIFGLSVSGKFIESISDGQILLSWGKEGIHYLKGKKWYPEDMTIRPEIFLNGVDPERKNFGLKAGLKMWINLESEGHMHSGLESDTTKQEFIKKLNNYA